MNDDEASTVFLDFTAQRVDALDLSRVSVGLHSSRRWL